MPKKMPPLKFKEPIWLQKLHTPSWLVLIISLIFLFRVPSFFEPFHYGDELIYITLGQGIKRGLVLFRDIHDNKPPLLYMLAAIAGNVFWFRAILAGWMIATTIIFWKLTTSLFPKSINIQKAAIVAFAILTTIPLLEGQIANAELFMIGPTIWAFYLLWHKKITTKRLILAGLLFSIGTLFKVPSAFDIFAIIFIWITVASFKLKNYKSLVKNSAILLAAWSLPILASLFYFASLGAFSDYLIAAFAQNIGYVSSFRPDDVAEPFLSKNAPLLIRFALTSLALLILFSLRKKLSKEFLFAVSWLALSLFAVTLSERPYPHYLIQSVPSISILVGILIAKKTKEQALSVIPLLIAILVPITFSFWYYPSLSYYENFVSFVTQNETKEEYFNYFNKDTNRNYKIAEFVLTSTSPDDNIFVWGDSPAAYALSNRLPPIKYIATYHIADFSTPEETLAALALNPPSLIIFLPNSPPFPELEDFANEEYFLINTIEDASIWRKLSPKMVESLRK